jgi:hypothetical protein
MQSTLRLRTPPAILALLFLSALCPLRAQQPRQEAAFSSSVDIDGPSSSRPFPRPYTVPERESSSRPFSSVALAASVGSLGTGGQIATPLSWKLSLRGQGEFFSYTSNRFASDGINYSGTLKFRSAEALLDWYPRGGNFHISPGIQFYNGLGAAANLSVPPGQKFSLNDTSYTSSTTAPLTGTVNLTTSRVAPMFTVGWGNLMKTHGHFTVPFEVGFVYHDAPTVQIHLAGSVCDSSGDCGDVNSDPQAQSDIIGQEKIIRDQVSTYTRFYPVISVGFAYKF